MLPFKSLGLANVTLFAALAMPGLAVSAGDPDLPLLGAIRPRAANEITSSTWSIGGETLDRDFAVYANYKKYLGPLGAKAIRLQAGWAKCEKKPGVYDWAWLDAIVDDARAQGVQPWLETSYGNPIYEGGGGTGLGGGFPHSPEALAAWDAWVRGLVRHFRDRVHQWEIWNEPDIRKGNSPGDYAALFVRTAEILRAEQAAARIYALALAGHLEFAEAFLRRIQEQGKTNLIDAVTIHGYPKNPDDTSNIDRLRALLARYAPAAAVRQGETGAPSGETVGALRNVAWTELKQAKWDLRRMLAHHGRDIPFNLFTLCELKYNQARMKGLNRKGLLRSNDDLTVAGPNLAYLAAQRVFAIFDDSLERSDRLKIEAVGLPAEQLAALGYRKKEGRAAIVVLWQKAHPPTDSNAAEPIDLTLHGLAFSEPVYADLLSGNIYTIPRDRWSRDAGGAKFKQMPIGDWPVLIAEKAALPLAAAGTSGPAAGSLLDPSTPQTNKDDGYRGIWFTLGQMTEYGDKYSGGLATYTANHVPMAIYSAVANKTFFVYGGAKQGRRYLLDMIGYYDHARGVVPRPTIVHDKQGIDDPHDNPSLCLDPQGYLWVFVSGRARKRPGFIYRSDQPYSIEHFTLVSQREITYPQPHWVAPQGFLHLFTKYTGVRELYWSTSPDGEHWTPDQKFAGIGGHYQTSAQRGRRVITAFNMHPGGNVDRRTNLYLLQTDDLGRTWQNVAGQAVTVPLTAPHNPALVRDYRAEKRLVYIHDLDLDDQGRPVILYITSASFKPGPEGDPRWWTVAHWTGRDWTYSELTRANHNYSTGSLYLEHGQWRVIGPTERGPQPIGGGGEVAIWVSQDQGHTWSRERDVTQHSPQNHNYVRRPLNAHPDFYAFWADGNPDKFSPSRLYFTNRAGDRVWRLPYDMPGAWAAPELISSCTPKN